METSGTHTDKQYYQDYYAYYVSVENNRQFQKLIQKEYLGKNNFAPYCTENMYRCLGLRFPTYVEGYLDARDDYETIKSIQVIPKTYYWVYLIPVTYLCGHLGVLYTMSKKTK